MPEEPTNLPDVLPGIRSPMIPDMAPYPGAWQPGPQRPGTWVRYLESIRRRKWWIIAATLGGLAIGTGGSRFVSPVYSAQTTLWLEITPRAATIEGPIRSSELLQSYSWIELLKSYSVLEHVVREQQLHVVTRPYLGRSSVADLVTTAELRPGRYRFTVDSRGERFALTGEQRDLIQSGAVGAVVGTPVGFAWRPPPALLNAGREIELIVLHPRDVARDLGDMLEARMAPQGNFLQVSLNGTDPVRIASTLNALSDRYVSVAAQLKRAKLDELTSVLAEQLAYAEQSLREAEIDLENFRIRTVTLPSERATPLAPGIQLTRDPVFDRFFDMRIELEQRMRDRAVIAQTLERMERNELSPEALLVVGAVGSSAELTRVIDERTERRAELRALEQRYTVEYLPVRRIREEVATLERQTIPALARGLLAQLEHEEAELAGQLQSASVELQRIPQRAIEEARLQRQVAISDHLFTMLKQRYEESRLAAESSIPDVRLLDVATVPHQPVQNRRLLIVLFAFVGSLGASGLGAILLDRLDPRLRYPDQVEEEIGLPILSTIPHLKRGESEVEAVELTERFRELRLCLEHGLRPVSAPLITISSPGCGDGKSFVALNLALAFADQGAPTLLIDADIRRGELQRSLSRNRSPGLTDFLYRSISLESIVQPTDVPSLSFIGAGSRMRNAPDLLNASRLRQLIDDLRIHYSAIIIDTPPLGAGVDAYTLAASTGNLLIVLRANQTDRGFAAARLTLLDRLPVRVLGAILNDVPSSSVFGYYGYLPGYGAVDEPAEVVASDAGRDTPRS
jgi:polysaccharide biosynthesis transport protein